MKLTTKAKRARNSNERRPLLASILYFEKFNFCKILQSRNFVNTLNYESSNFNWGLKDFTYTAIQWKYLFQAVKVLI